MVDRTYKSWSEMKQRCDNPKNKNYENYGGRGISYDPSWREFKNFRADMGRRPEGTTLDRENNEKGYCKDNCRWADSVTQNNNRRERKLMTAPRSDSFNKILGVSIVQRRGGIEYHAYGQRQGVRQNLYYGRDYFEACCARKSFEAHGGLF